MGYILITSNLDHEPTAHQSQSYKEKLSHIISRSEHESNIVKDKGSSLLISAFMQKSQFCTEPDLVLVCSSLYSIKIFISTSVQHQSSHMHLYKRIGHMHQSDHMDHSSHMLYQKCISTTPICLSTNQVMCIN